MKSTKSSIISALGLATLACAPIWAQANTTTQTYTPGVTYQATNPNYPLPNPFYFEGRIDWNLLKIDQPKNAWEYMERGIHYQDDLEDEASAIKDYQTAISMNNLDNGTCQLVTAPLTNVTPGQQYTLSPPPCIFTVRLRLGYLLRESNPEQALSLFEQVLNIDPMRLGVNALIGEVYTTMAKEATDQTERHDLYDKAINAYKAELALSPVTPLYTQLTGDEANNAHVHWSMAEIYRSLGDNTDAIAELQSYLKATKWHSDTYPWRIQLAQKRINELQEKPGAVSSHHRK
jgi:tetratricopeptide (TPR) repeat protein